MPLEMIRLDAGKAVPWHTHKGRELTLCVHGEYADGLATYGPGDFSIGATATQMWPAWMQKAYAAEVANQKGAPANFDVINHGGQPTDALDERQCAGALGPMQRRPEGAFSRET